MADVRHVSVKHGDVLLLVGTMKGAFLLRFDAARTRWERGGPYFPGQAVYALAYDGRGGARRLWAGTAGEHWGPTLASSDDFGRAWNTPDSAALRFPEDTGAALKRIWQIRPGRADEPRTIYCGVEPAALFESHDGGAAWSLVRGLHDHPHRPRWMPGGGGLCLHTIIPDAARRPRVFIALSAGVVYAPDGGGADRRVRNGGGGPEVLAAAHPELGQRAAKVAPPPSRPRTRRRQ